MYVFLVFACGTGSFFERIDRALRRSPGVYEMAQVPLNVVPAPPVATSEPEADPEAILSAEDQKGIKRHLADPDLEVFDKTPDEDVSEPPKHETVEKETGSQTPVPSSAAPETTATAARNEL